MSAPPAGPTRYSYSPWCVSLEDMSGMRRRIAEYGARTAGVTLMRRWRSQGRAVKGGRGLGVALCCALASVCQSGVAAPASLQSVRPRECLAIDSAHPVKLALLAPAAGVLRVTVEERGISTVSFLHDGEAPGLVRTALGSTASEPANAAASPIER